MEGAGGYLAIKSQLLATTMIPLSLLTASRKVKHDPCNLFSFILVYAAKKVLMKDLMRAQRL
ncbi:hypothetical protein IKX73_00540 [Candidatus Saccharibacteria bacterium]|nr:hypothetical protein [Candidatus Saccharibacteria bacterium]